MYPSFPKTSFISVKNVYGVDEPTIPAGYEATGEFRWPTVDPNEYYLGALHSCAGQVYPSEPNSTLNEPRIILRVKPKRKVVTFTHTGTFVQNVPPGQYYYWSANDSYYQSFNAGHCFVQAVELVTRVISEV